MSENRNPTDIKIEEAARKLNRGYTWVYERLEQIAKHTYRYKGVIFIRDEGLRALQELNAKAPKRGRPRKSPTVA